MVGNINWHWAKRDRARMDAPAVEDHFQVLRVPLKAVLGLYEKEKVRANQLEAELLQKTQELELCEIAHRKECRCTLGERDQLVCVDLYEALDVKWGVTDPYNVLAQLLKKVKRIAEVENQLADACEREARLIEAARWKKWPEMSAPPNTTLQVKNKEGKYRHAQYRPDDPRNPYLSDGWIIVGDLIENGVFGVTHWREIVGPEEGK